MKSFMKYDVIFISGSLNQDFPSPSVATLKSILNRDTGYKSKTIDLTMHKVPITNMILLVITTSFNVYYLPRLSEIKEKKVFLREMKHAYLIYLPVITTILLVSYIFKEQIITILFQKEFISMKELFLFQFIGIFCKVGKA